MNQFLQQHGWTMGPVIAGDASARRYFRVNRGGKTAVLMDTSEEPETMQPFIQVARWLNDAGLKAPEIYEVDETKGCLILEDLGGVSFRALLDKGHDAKEIYTLAADVLSHLRKVKPPSLQRYEDSKIHKGHQRVIDWYVPAVRQAKNPDDLLGSYLSAWQEIEQSLPPYPRSFVHGDFHLENMMWLPGEKGIKRCGLLDFQDAMNGSAAYDLANLLEDARINVPQDIQSRILAGHDKDFLAWYRVLATQFHCRIAGWCIRMAIVNNKPRYIDFLPRIENYIKTALKDPLLKPLKAFFAQEKIDFSGSKDLNASRVAGYIRSDAF